MRTITLQENEAEELERILNAMLISGVLKNGAERRAIRRISMKLHWAKAEKCKPAA